MKQQLFSRIKGEGEPVLILHGLFGAGDNLGRLANHLASAFEVHLLDMRNHGASFHAPDMNYPSMAQDVLSYADEQKIDQFRVFGHSMGGKIAMQSALLWPNRIKKLIVGDIAPVTYTPHHVAIFAGLDAINFETLGSRQEADEILARHVEEQSVRQFLLKNLKRTSSGQYEWKMNLASIKDNYSNIMQGQESDQPYPGDVLFIGGGDSDYFQPEYAAHTRSLFPNAKVKMIPDTSHWLHAEKPELFNSLCLKFLKE